VVQPSYTGQDGGSATYLLFLFFFFSNFFLKFLIFKDF